MSDFFHRTIFLSTIFFLILVAVAAAPVAVFGQSEDLRAEVEQLKKIVMQQQERINALEAERKHSVDPPSSSPAPQPAAAPEQKNSVQATNQADQHSGSSDERIRNLERQIKGIGPISFSGDIRLREEPIFGGPADESLQRARTRLRVRFNAVADLGEQFRAGFSLAGGDSNDPISTNQTLTGFYTRKPVGIDLAFVEYKPKWLRPFSFTGGKFRYPWYNTELTWDKDLNPEGAAQSFVFDLQTPVLKRIALIGFELPLAEVAGTLAADKRIVQDITYGGQLQTTWQVAPRMQLSAYSSFYDFRGADSIALASARAGSRNPQTPLVGLLPLGGNTPQNSMIITTANNAVIVGANRIPTGTSTVTNAQFASRFGLFDNIARLDINTGQPTLPLTFIGDYVQNTEACANAAKLFPTPANTATLTFTTTSNAPCNPHARRAYWLEARLGRLQERGDWQAGYARIFIEREAVLGNFNYSELRQGSNVTQHRLDLFYQLRKSVQLGTTVLVGRPLASTEHYLTRIQFDTVYIF
ncbi:MAG TPA: putative porin [Candidatus Angelobacter sp.]|nr:putative porin [Candidatus Angelobacter sp.]